jgi:excinuclease ABC subunit C
MADVMHVTRSSSASFDFRPERYPDHPGCYLMKGAGGQILYVGKANSLRLRLASYFRESEKRHRKSEVIRRIREIDVFLVRNEREALVLESNLIRLHDPPHNSRFTREDDSYYYIARTHEAFPRFVPYRKRRANFALKNGDKEAEALFGPYVGWHLRNRILDAVRTEFPLRTCHTMAEGPCVRFETGGCQAPCANRISAEAYRSVVARASRFLRRPPAGVMREISRRMRDAARAHDFERAAELRDRLRALEHAAAPQVAERSRRRNVLVAYLEGGLGLVMTVRHGIIEGLGPLSAAAATPNGSRLFLESACRSCQPDGVITNAVLEAGWALPPVRIPRTDRSYAGQLLEICRLNHAYRSGAARPSR